MAYWTPARGNAAAGVLAPILATLAALGILAAAATVIILSLIPVYLPTKVVPRRTNDDNKHTFLIDSAQKMLTKVIDQRHIVYWTASSGNVTSSAWAPIVAILTILAILAVAAGVIVLALIPVYLPTKVIPRRTNATTTTTTMTTTTTTRTTTTTTTTLAPTTLSHTTFAFVHRSMSHEDFELFEIVE
ncbi:unnamed protein product [Rotaria sordida]|uniref:Uncharacterized protein n=1 Tax=Rotaria sordida TaxID=392033 RepID=A0A815HV26_9BILA|nr:unnamed protein product [Rotaria sordida]